jgi:DNA (cytosine-5)-methyltransferase 1
LDFDAVFEGILTPRRAKAYNRWREQAIKAYGNAVVPQVVLQIFETINEYEALSRAERSGK